MDEAKRREQAGGFVDPNYRWGESAFLLAYAEFDVLKARLEGGLNFGRNTVEILLAIASAQFDERAADKAELAALSARVAFAEAQMTEAGAKEARALQRAYYAEQHSAALCADLVRATAERDQLRERAERAEARNLELEANLLDYWSRFGAVAHVEEPRVVRELRERAERAEAVIARVREYVAQFRRQRDGLWKDATSAEDSTMGKVKGDAYDDVIESLEDVLPPKEGT